MLISYGRLPQRGYRGLDHFGWELPGWAQTVVGAATSAVNYINPPKPVVAPVTVPIVSAPPVPQPGSGPSTGLIVGGGLGVLALLYFLSQNKK